MRAVLIAVLILLISIPIEGANAQGGVMDWLRGGPRSYEECILRNMQGVTSDEAARSIRAACAARNYSTQPRAAVRPEVDVSASAVDIVFTFDFRASNGDTYYYVYHASPGIRITRIEISTTDGLINRTFECRITEMDFSEGLPARRNGRAVCATAVSDMDQTRISSRISRVFGRRE